jgi:glycosyltransferase involved in cell wall biosynthesis
MTRSFLMASSMFNHEGPMVSLILCTFGRPAFLEIILRCLRNQTYQNMEVIVVNDGPGDPRSIAAICPSKVITLAKRTPLGEKLNYGIDASNGQFLFKIDDDDYYSASYVSRMMEGVLSSASDSKSVSFAQPYLFFDLRRRKFHMSDEQRCSGATLVFSRDSWIECPFRADPSAVDASFLLDRLEMGHTLNPVYIGEMFIQIRHGLGHIWNYLPWGQSVDAYMQELGEWEGDEHAVFPEWVLSAYSAIRTGTAVRSHG